MCPKTASLELNWIAGLASKYLLSLDNQRSLSKDTVRAYTIDLSQAFGREVGRNADFSGLPQTCDEAALLARCRGAMTAWGKLAPASRNRKAAALKSFLHWLHEERLTTRDLATQIHGPKVPSRLPHYLSMDEALALVRSLDAQNDELGRRDRALVLLLYGAGLRVSEACGLKWTQVDQPSRVIRVLGKGNKERLVATPEKVMTALGSLPRLGSYVFGEEPLSTRKAYDIVRAQGARAGLIQALHPHALRHSFATHLLSSGANLRTLQELLGHRTLQATQRYTHVGLDQLARTLEDFHPFGIKTGAKRK